MVCTQYLELLVNSTTTTLASHEGYYQSRLPENKEDRKEAMLGNAVKQFDGAKKQAAVMATKEAVALMVSAVASE